MYKKYMSKNLFLTITNGLWLIDPERAKSYGLLVNRILNGEKAYFDSDEEKKEKPIKAYSVDISGVLELALKNESNIFNKAKPNSIAVISIEGPMMKHDNCGDPGTETYQQWINQALANPNISGIVLDWDSPGGSVDGTEALSNCIGNASKPIVSLVNNLMASAAYWCGSKSNHIMAANKTSQIGSIGTMASFADMQPYWEKMGVNFHEIYATKSTDKNATFNEARKGNYDKLKSEVLDPINEIFLQSVQQSRAGKINLKKENVLSGKVYLAEDAISNGLIDSIGSLDNAIEKATELANNQIANFKPTNMKKLSMFAVSLVSFLSGKGFTSAGEQTNLTEDQIILINDQHTSLTSENARLTSELAIATGKVTEKENALSAAATEITELKAKVTLYGGANAGATTTKKAGNDSIENESEEEEFMTSVDKEKANLKAKGLL